MEPLITKLIYRISPQTEVGKEQLPPTKPPSGFAKYIMENRAAFLQKPSVGEATKALAEQWNQLSGQEKKASNLGQNDPKYEATTEEWEEYHRRTVEWKETVPPKILKEINKKRKAKGLKPLNTRTRKAPVTSYFLFLRDFKASPPPLDANLTGTERMIELVRLGAAQWRGLSDAERQVNIIVVPSVRVLSRD
ncbi:hypothetical protein H1R20_g3987, partial [Candolleomyces eurysporus]